MLGRNHALSGAVGFLATGPLVVPNATMGQHALGTVVCAAWALVPDLDHPGAAASRRLGVVGRLLSGVIRVLAGGHRQGTHSLAASALVALGAWWVTYRAPSPTIAAVIAALAVIFAAPLLGKAVGVTISAALGLGLGITIGWLLWTGTVVTDTWFFWAMTLGFTLHWIGDVITSRGVSLLWPVSRRRVKVPLFTTGSGIETVIAAILAAAFTVLGWQQFSPALPWM